MASLTDAIALLSLLLVLQPMTCSSDFLSPLLSPVMGEVCKAVACGKGKCKPVENSTFHLSYHCECDPGWKRTLHDGDAHLKFLPCVIPNCTLHHACAAAPSPVTENSPKTDDSILNICHWVYCGGGLCNRTSVFTHSCECSPGYYNLMNISTFPCFRECEIGVDCANLGIAFTNKPPFPTFVSSENGGANLIQNYAWPLLISVTLLLWTSLI